MAYSARGRRFHSDGSQGAAREISVPIFEPHPKIGAEIDREALNRCGINTVSHPEEPTISHVPSE
jgi:hypothetical protein